MKTLRRTIHPVVKILDEKNFIAEFTASDETLDLQNEVIRAAGWRFNLCQKNFPFVNSHDYSDIRNTLGKVIDFGVVGGKLMNTVQYACDVAENELAMFAWKMMLAKFLPAVSVGCQVTRAASRWDTDKTEYNQQCAELKLAREVSPDVIYIEQEQLELSQCVLGANPNAVAQIEKAYQAGAINDADIASCSKISRDFASAFEQRNQRRTTYSFGASESSPAIARMLKALGRDQTSNQPTPINPMSKTKFLEDFGRLTGSTKTAFSDIETARRNGGEAELKTALLSTRQAMAGEQRMAGDPVAHYFSQHPAEKLFWNAVARKIGGKLKAGTAEHEMFEAVKKSVVPGLATDDSFGTGMFPIPVSPEIFDLLYIYGAFKDLGVNEMLGQYTKFVIVNGYPTILVYASDQQGYVTVPADTTTSGLDIGGPNVGQACSSFIGMIEASRELLNDPKIDLSGLIFRLFFQAIAGAIDYCAFVGNGNDDLTNGSQTGIFMDANIKSYQPNVPGKSTISTLSREDFINTIAVVKPAALQRPCRWYISPAFIPKLMALKDGDGASWLLRTPADTGGEWHLVGFPVTWAAAAPAIELAAQKIAAFGEPNSYCVGIRNLFELMAADGARFNHNIKQIRAIARGKCVTRDATGFGTLKLSAQ
jgi:hypothetical protein